MSALSVAQKNPAAVSETRITHELAVIRASLLRVKEVDQAEKLSQRAYALAELSERAKLSAEIKIEAAELVLRCERALGQAILEKPQAPRGRPQTQEINGSKVDPFIEPPSLRELGIIKRRADACRSLARLDEERFEELIEEGNERAQQGIDRASQALSVSRIVRQIKQAEPSSESEFSSLIKPTDNWNFSPVHYDRIDGEEGHGYIPGEIYANCLWYYTQPGNTVVAPMAGGGQILRVYEDRRSWARPEPWDLSLHLFDLNPRGKYADQIRQNDLTTGLPIKRADYIVMDVPYFGMVDGQYSNKPEDLANMDEADWTRAMRQIATVCGSVQAAQGLCTVITPNYRDVKTGTRILATRIVQSAFQENDYELFDLAYASRRIQQSQAPGMGVLNNTAKRNRTMLTDISEVMTFIRS